ncbi:MAG: hypothetical protein U0R44_06015 [Candidatus Micrarchaeia archaeon]
MKLLIDYLEESAAYLRERKEKLKALDAQFRRVYDSDLKHEMAEIRRDIAKKDSEVTTELLYNLEEFRSLNKYYPALLQVFMEDEYIGKVIAKKAWLLDYRPLPPQEAAAKLGQLRAWRKQLKDARKALKHWVGTVDSRAFVATFPVLRGQMSGELDKIDAIAAIDKTDKLLLKEGWLLLISDSLIEIPIAKFMTNINQLRYQEITAQTDFSRSRGRGTVAETKALRNLQSITKSKQHYERALTQMLLANPNYLKELKKRKDWLSRDKGGNLEKLAKGITPHTIKERVWLNEMRKKVSVEEGQEAPTERAPAAQAPKSLARPGKTRAKRKAGGKKRPGSIQ